LLERLSALVLTELWGEAIASSRVLAGRKGEVALATEAPDEKK
jgi:hypothetical protein